MSWATDRIVETCEALANEDDRRFNRCLVAMRRSGRDVFFNAHIARRRIEIVVAKPIVAVLDWMTLRMAPQVP